MIERRPLGTGLRPTTPTSKPHDARRAQLAAEGTDTASAAQADIEEHHQAVTGRRTLGPGTTVDRD